MKVTIQSLARGYLVTRMKPSGPLAGMEESYAEPSASAALHLVSRWLGVEPATLYAPTIALADGHPATGGGESSQTLLDAGEFVELAPAVAAMIETQSDEPPFRNPDAPVGDGEELPEAMS